MAAAIEWVDRRGPIGSLQEQRWLELHSTEPITFAAQVAAIKAVLAGLQDYPAQLVSGETGDDGAPQLRDEIVSRAEVLCALSRLPQPQRDAIQYVYINGATLVEAAKALQISTSLLGKRVAAALAALVPMVFDYAAGPPQSEQENCDHSVTFRRRSDHSGYWGA